MNSIYVFLAIIVSTTSSFNENDSTDDISLGEVNINAFIEPDTQVTGELVANYKGDSLQNPDELGAYFEGDIRLPQSLLAKNGLVAKTSRWPNGVVPYIISGNFTKEELSTIDWAFEEYKKQSCIRFEPRTNEKDYISIENKKSGCWAYLGRIGGRQQLNLQTPACLLKRGVVVHELLHAVGVEHEHSRHDRDNYVTINRANIQRNMASNFDKVRQNYANAGGIEYDYTSIMHYSPYAFSKNGKPTIAAKKNSEEAQQMGQRNEFSKADINKLKMMYKC